MGRREHAWWRRAVMMLDAVRMSNGALEATCDVVLCMWHVNLRMTWRITDYCPPS